MSTLHQKPATKQSHPFTSPSLYFLSALISFVFVQLYSFLFRLSSLLGTLLLFSQASLALLSPPLIKVHSHSSNLNQLTLTPPLFSQLQHDGYVQQALQLELATLQSSGSVRPSDKLGSLFSSCLLSVSEVTGFFSARGKRGEISNCVNV